MNCPFCPSVSSHSIFIPELSLGQPLCRCLCAGLARLSLACLLLAVRDCGFVAGCGRLNLLIPHSCQSYCSGMLTSSVLLHTLLCRCYQNLLCVFLCHPPMPDICSRVSGPPRMLLFLGKIQESLLGLTHLSLSGSWASLLSCPWKS